jgi:putative FmdB family regulatory protein
MPIYEYQCNVCDHQFDALQKMNDAPLIDCPACNKPELYKKVSAPGFRLSGSGWYETDFKSDKQKNLTKSDTGDKPSTTTSTKATTDNSAKKEAAAS